MKHYEYEPQDNTPYEDWQDVPEAYVQAINNTLYEAEVSEVLLGQCLRLKHQVVNDICITCA